MKDLGEKSLNFSKATNDLVLRNIPKLNTKKASELNDIPTKYIKKLSDVFTPGITGDYNNYIAIGIFPECFKTAEVIPTYKKDKPTEKKLTTSRLVYFRIYLKFIKDLCMIIWVITLMMFYQNFSAASEKVLVPKTVYYIW